MSRSLLRIFCFLLLAVPLNAAPSWLPGYRVRYEVEVPEYPNGDKVALSDGWSVASIPSGGWARPDGADVQAQDESGNRVVTQVISVNPEGNAIVQFKGGAGRYWINVGNPQFGQTGRVTSGQAPSLEIRPYSGERINSWEQALAELNQLQQIDGNSIVSSVRYFGNLYRNHKATAFVAISRGHLQIPAAGKYRFSVSSDDASFLFLNRQLVFEQTGERPASSNVEEWYEAELPAGPVAFEYFHFAGNRARNGYGNLLWKRPDSEKWERIPPEVYLQSPAAILRRIETPSGPVATFEWGVDETPVSEQAQAYLVRFKAHGQWGKPEDLRWDFGDGNAATGEAVRHVYFEPGDHLVTLHVGNLPPLKRRIFVYEQPVNASPESLDLIMAQLAKSQWTGQSIARLNRAFDFVTAARMPNRWLLQSTLARALIGQKEIDGPRKARLYEAYLEAMAESGRASEAIQLKDRILNDFRRASGLQIDVIRAVARLHWKYLSEYNEASELYAKLLEENQRLNHPSLRLAAIEWGDMFLASGDMKQARERYQLATTLGGEGFSTTTSVRNIQRGTQLRVAEQRLRAGSIRESRVLLDKIELDNPEQKLEGLFRFLRAEVDRAGGNYAEALASYELLLKLPQWSGYRDRALAGIARCQFHLGQKEKATELLEGIKNSFPEFYEKEKLGELAARIDEAAGPNPAAPKDPADVPGRKPRDLTPFVEGELNGRIVGVQGFGIRDAILGEVIAGWVGINSRFEVPVDEMSPNATYWVEFWYRDTVGDHRKTIFFPHFQGSERNQAEGNASTYYADRTDGRWRKVGRLAKMPAETSAQFNLDPRLTFGAFQIDGIRIVPAEEHDIERLTRFLQGSISENE